MKRYLDRAWNLGVLTWERFCSVEGSEAAAAIAYYALFSLFPLLLVVIMALSSVFDDPGVYAQVMAFTQSVFPGSEAAIRGTMDQIIAVKGISFWSWGGVIGFGVLLWSASSVFAGLVQNINQAWHLSTPRHFLSERIIAVAMIFVLFLVLVVSVLLNAILKFYRRWLAIQVAPHLLLPFQSETSRFLLWLAPVAVTFLAFVLMYRYIPNTRVLWREAAWGGLFSTATGEITKAGFVWWYVHQGARSFLNLYGSMSAFAVLMLWIYLYSFIILLGANLSASIAYSTRLQENEIDARDATAIKPFE